MSINKYFVFLYFWAFGQTQAFGLLADVEP